MKILIRRLILLVLAKLPIASISFAVQKDLILGELKDYADPESVFAPIYGS